MKQRPDPFERGRDDGPLFQTPERALSGRTDPETSRKAAAQITEQIGKAQAVALAWVKNHPGMTAPELGELAALRYGTDKEAMRQRIGRRLNELEKAGLIRRDGERGGCCCWWPAER